MGWWDTFTKGAIDYATTGTTGNSLGDAAADAALGYVLDKTGVTGSMQPNIAPVGYQGGIPSYKAVRERVPTNQDRRAGGQNQRYFTDTQFAMGEKGFKEARPKSVEEAKARAILDRDTLGQRNMQQIPQSSMTQPTQAMAAGGIASAYNRPHNGYYLGGVTDGMADEVPASIDGTQEARLSDGEFVIPADVVSHLGNGNSDAGAQQLHGMMDNVRMERTGNPEQGKQIDPNKFMPKMSQGGGIAMYQNGGPIRKFNVGGETDTTSANPNDVAFDPNVGQKTGVESSLSSWAGPYVTDMLGKGAALAETPYQEFQGPLTAGTSDLQQKSFEGIGALSAPANMGVDTFDATQAQKYMNPYLMASINPQIEEARRQSEIQRVSDAGRLTKAGAFGGSRQAVMEAEGNRSLGDRIADITGQGYASAYDKGLAQFNLEQGNRNKYGFDVLGGQGTAGATQRAQEQQGLSADIAQFEEERDFPYKQVQYMQSLLQGLPLEAQSISYSQPSDFQKNMEAVGGVSTMLQDLYGGGTKDTSMAGFGSATPQQINQAYIDNPNVTPAEIAKQYPGT